MNEQATWIVQPPEADAPVGTKPGWRYKYYRIYDWPVRAIGTESYRYLAEAPSRTDGKLALNADVGKPIDWDDAGVEEISKAEFVEMCRAFEEKHNRDSNKMDRWLSQ